MFDYIIGAGQGGCRIAKTFSEELDIDACYLNFADVDFNKFEVPSKKILCMDGSGTGRSPATGENLADYYSEDIVEFLANNIDYGDGKYLLCVGGGGGSGSGMMFEIIKYLLSLHSDVLLIYTLPQKREGIPTKPNALKSLNKLIIKYLEKDKISTLIVDNDLCSERFDVGGSVSGNYWGGINKGIVKSLNRFYSLTTLENKSVDINSGFSSLDVKEFYRILFMKGGFLDLRSTSFQSPDVELAKKAKFPSLLFNGLDIGSSKRYIVSIGVPIRFQYNKRLNEFIDVVFKRLEKLTKTQFVLRSSYFNRLSEDIRVDIMLSGVATSKGIMKMIKQTSKDVSKYKSKEGIKRLDLESINF